MPSFRKLLDIPQRFGFSRVRNAGTPCSLPSTQAVYVTPEMWGAAPHPGTRCAVPLEGTVPSLRRWPSVWSRPITLIVTLPHRTQVSRHPGGDPALTPSVRCGLTSHEPDGAGRTIRRP